MNFEFDDFYLEPIQEKHAWRICDFCVINNDHIKRFFPKTLEQNINPSLSQFFVEQKVKEFASKKEFLWVLKEKKEHKIIGLVYIKDLIWANFQGELAYCISKSHAGKGYITAVVRKLTTFAFTELGLKKLVIIVHKSNIPSVKVAEKNEFIWTKTLKEHFAPPNENTLDMELYEMNMDALKY